MGKTTLARKYLHQRFATFLEFPIAKETKDIASIEGLLEEKLRQLGEEPGREFLVSLDRLKRKLQAEAIGILIDNLEPALDSAGRFIEPHRRYVELLRVLADPMVRSVTLITSREHLRESSVTVQHYALRSLDITAWEQFFQNRNLATPMAALRALHHAYGGNAKAMDIISGAILEDFSGNVEAYWQANQDDLLIERDLEDLVTQQFDRLRQLDPDAYNLLCRMGCYRYQDVPTVPIEGLFCLLWDVPENRHRRVIKSLQDRSLVDFSDGEFWLHPVIREEAITQLKADSHWETANYQTADFWTNSIHTVATLEDALRAFEAFHHYIVIDDFKSAGKVIVGRRDNEWERGEHLGRSLYRLSLLQTTISAINRVINNLDDGILLGKLYYLLSGVYRLTGNAKEAIICCGKIQEIAFKNNNKWLQMVALQNLGLVKIALLELEEATKIFEETLVMAEQEGSQSYVVTYYFCLAFLNSCFAEEKSKDKALYFAKNTFDSLVTRTDLSPWRKGYGFIFLGLTFKNLENIEESFRMFQTAISFATKSHYAQIKAEALSGMSELYRMREDFEVALLHHSKAIEILEKIGAKYNLAEAFYQRGLTYQAINKIEKSNENFQEAIRLFSEMGAPKQVERVRKSMESEN
ncbi:MAG: tetratricopeptide repeat protein [Scytolyngbya sp. HA4215-MV1]|nr:tetratricopeptide repeat protein [Scytolyngbya sp. HA4215-MV1]